MDNQELAKKIMEYRAKHNITDVQFCKLCGISVTTLFRLRCGREIGKFSLEKICQTIGAKKK